jgi:hypothetical protein
MSGAAFDHCGDNTGCETITLFDRATSDGDNVEATPTSSVVHKDYSASTLSHSETLAFLNCVSDMTDEEILRQFSKKVSRPIDCVFLPNSFWSAY